ncbi:hypothetical protein Pan241w_14230 [Gimesia alba]|uniref:Uncharacterized protein n=1 Tax=Gimesia alba TaxID=2527973 RepID=A0A517RBZ0_9PLAN|nr:hypothetical protein Pan241w_14230 [Gimesia alba]
MFAKTLYSILQPVFFEPIRNLLDSATLYFCCDIVRNSLVELKGVVFLCIVTCGLLEVKPGRAVSFWQEKSKKTVSLATFNQVRGGNRLQICLREVIFARFNYCMLAEYQPEFRVESLQLSLQNVSCQRRIAKICPDGYGK